MEYTVTHVFLFLSIVCKCHMLSIGTVSENVNVTGNASEPSGAAQHFFPDWVPFKNKRGEELGEFVDVQPKAKVKKRLALPLNFILRAVAEPQGDDYYDKGQGETESEDYFEKNEWSDTNRQDSGAPSVINSLNNSNPFIPLNHTDLSDIDGVVSIIKDVNPPLIVETIRKASEDFSQNKHKTADPVNEREENVEYNENSSSESIKPKGDFSADLKKKNANDEYAEYEENISSVPNKPKGDSSADQKKKNPNDEDTEYEENISSEKQKQQDVKETNAEDEAKKAKALESVDELKLRHAEEQRYISERAKEDERIAEEHARLSGHRQRINSDKYDNIFQSRKPIKDYEDYDAEEEKISYEDKYKLKRKPPTTSTSTTTTTPKPTLYPEVATEKKVSIFTNPHLYMVSDEYEDRNLNKLARPRVFGEVNKNSTKIEDLKKSDEDDSGVPIALVPKDSVGSIETPTLFYPKRRKNKRKRKYKHTTTPREPTYKEIEKTIASKPATTASGSSEADTWTADTKKTEINAVPTHTMLNTAPNTVGTQPSSFEGDTTSSDKFSSVEGDSKSSAKSSGTEGDTTPSDSFTSPSATETDSSAPDTSSTEGDSPHDFATSAEIISPLVLRTTPMDSVSSGSDTEPSTEDATGSSGTSFTSVTSPSAQDEISTNSDSVTDVVPASSEHKKEEHDGGNREHKKGGGRDYHSEHEEERGEHGKKAYEGVHKDSKTAKGHHDKEGHEGKYHDEGGHDKYHHDEKKHYGSHHHEENGKKHAKYEESGKHSKGHSTKGSHDIHKKEEYEKKVEFFEEEGDSAEEEKHGGFHDEREHKKGGGFKHGNLKAGHEHHEKGEKGHYGKGGHSHVQKAHSVADGHDSHGKHGQSHGSSGGAGAGKKWVYHHGYPAKNANLIPIDRRREDRYIFGPQHFG